MTEAVAKAMEPIVAVIPSAVPDWVRPEVELE